MHDLHNTANTRTEIETVISNRARALALDIVHRIRPVCAHMPDTELLELATQMAQVELSYFEQAVVPTIPRRRPARA